MIETSMLSVRFTKSGMIISAIPIEMEQNIKAYDLIWVGNTSKMRI